MKTPTLFLLVAASSLIAAAMRPCEPQSYNMYAHRPAADCLSVQNSRVEAHGVYGSTAGDPCSGCGAEGGSGVANPAQPNNPDENGDSDAPDATGEDGTFETTTVTAPATANGSWLLITSGGGTFESDPGKCKEGGLFEPPCIQDFSCKWRLKDTNETGDSTFTMTIRGENPGAAGTTNPSVSSNLVQDPDANPPEYSATFCSADPDMEPSCGGEIEYVVTWKLAGADQRWELSFRCTDCEES